MERMMMKLMKLIVCSSFLWILPLSISTIIDGDLSSSSSAVPIVDTEKTGIVVEEGFVFPTSTNTASSSSSIDENQKVSSSSSHNSSSSCEQKLSTSSPSETAISNSSSSIDESLSLEINNNSTNDTSVSRNHSMETTFERARTKTTRTELVRKGTILWNESIEVLTNWYSAQKKKKENQSRSSSSENNNTTYTFALNQRGEHFMKKEWNNISSFDYFSYFKKFSSLFTTSTTHPLLRSSTSTTIFDEISILTNSMKKWNTSFYSNFLFRVKTNQESRIEQEEEDIPSIHHENDRHRRNETITAEWRNNDNNSNIALSNRFSSTTKLLLLLLPVRDKLYLHRVFEEREKDLYEFTKNILDMLQKLYGPIVRDATSYVREHDAFFKNIYYFCMAVYQIIRIVPLICTTKQKQKEEEEEEANSTHCYEGEELFHLGREQFAVGRHKDACKYFAKANVLQRRSVAERTNKLADLYHAQALKHCDDDDDEKDKYLAIVMLGISELLKHRPLNPQHIQMATQFQAGYKKKGKRDPKLSKEIDRTLMDILLRADPMATTIKAHASSMKVVKQQQRRRRRRRSKAATDADADADEEVCTL